MRSTTPTRRLLSIRDVCERYTVSERTVLDWLHSGQLRGLNVGRRPDAGKPRWRISEEALAEFEASRTPTLPPPVSRRKRKLADVIEFY
jgi:excisionase family DNA binding protein